MEDRLKRRDGENEDQYLWRLAQMREAGEEGLDWQKIADLVNAEFRSDETEYRTESAYRKKIAAAKKVFESGVFDSQINEERLQEMREQLVELQKLKQEISDERRDYQRSVREESRASTFAETIRSIMSETVEPFENSDKEVKEAIPYTVYDREMIVCLSDIHAGIKVDNFVNYYDSSEVSNRLKMYTKRIEEILNCNSDIKVCHVALGGDNISGAIHSNLRLENNENVVRQVKLVSIAIADFIDDLSNMFGLVNVYSVSGNHSRVFANKKEHVTGEELDDLIPFYLEMKFSKTPNVSICAGDDYKFENPDPTIKRFVVSEEHVFYLVHGDKDSPSNVVKNITLMFGEKPAAIIMSHRHHNAYDTQYGVKVIQNGSVVGTDRYCIDHRISGRPEQMVIIANSEDAVECIYDIPLTNSL